MAYTNLPVVTVAHAGDAVEPVTVPSGDGAGLAFTNDGRTYLELSNVDANGDAVFNIVSGAKLGGLDVADLSVTVGNNSRKIVGPFPANVFNQQSGTDRGKVLVTVSGTGAADAKAAAFK